MIIAPQRLVNVLGATAEGARTLKNSRHGGVLTTSVIQGRSTGRTASELDFKMWGDVQAWRGGRGLGYAQPVEECKNWGVTSHGAGPSGK